MGDLLVKYSFMPPARRITQPTVSRAMVSGEDPKMIEMQRSSTRARTHSLFGSN